MNGIQAMLQTLMSTKMQLDVDVSPPANIMTLRLDLTNVTFDLDMHDV